MDEDVRFYVIWASILVGAFACCVIATCRDMQRKKAEANRPKPTPTPAQ